MFGKRIHMGAIALLCAAVALTACSAELPANSAPKTSTRSVVIVDNHGEIEVPVNPQRVVALDNTVLDTLSDWGVELVAAPKAVMGSVWPRYSDDANVRDVGNHREPNLEAIVAAQPDLIIGGYRFGDYYDELKTQNPSASVIEISPRDTRDAIAERVRQTEILGTVFGREADAAAIVAQLNDAVAGAQAAYNGTDTVMAVNTSAGSIGYLAPGAGRALGPVFPALNLIPALDASGDGDHRGNDIGVEAIAASNPDWILALDRDASFAIQDRDTGSAPASELINDSEALQGVTAVQRRQVIILDDNFYLTEGIQAYTALFQQIRDAFAAA